TRREQPLVPAVGVHDVELGNIVALMVEIESGISDLLAVGRGQRTGIRSLAGGQLADRAVLDAKGVDIVAFERVVGIRDTLAGSEDPLAVRGPGGAAAGSPATHAAGMIEVAAGDLAGRAADRRYYEDVRVARTDQPAPVGAPAQPGDDDRRI